MIKIDDGVPLPANAGRVSKYPFGDLKAGQSFFVDFNNSVSKMRSFRTLVSKKGAMMRANGENVKFTVAPELSGLRVWRV